MKHRRGPNLPIALASILLSIMLWFVVFTQNVRDPQNVRAPLTVDGLDDARFFARRVPGDVRLVVNAPAERAKELADERVVASVDLSSPVVGDHDYPLAISPDWVRRYLDDPHPKVRVEIEPMAERAVDVSTVVKGALRDPNLLLKRRQTSPARVRVRGPAPEVTAVTEVLAYVDLAQIDPLNPSALASELQPLDGRGSRLEHVRVLPQMAATTFKLAAAEASKPATVVPDLTGVTYDPSVLPGGYRIDPSVVSLSGKPAILANVSKVPTEVIRLPDLGRTRTVHVRLLAPEGTTVVDSPEVDVTVLVRRAPAPVVAPPRSADAPSAGGARTPRPPSSVRTP